MQSAGGLTHVYHVFNLFVYDLLFHSSQLYNYAGIVLLLQQNLVYEYIPASDKTSVVSSESQRLLWFPKYPCIRLFIETVHPNALFVPNTYISELKNRLDTHMDQQCKQNTGKSYVICCILFFVCQYTNKGILFVCIDTT